jgi:DNA-binding MarR family transcriptional regulator
MSPSNITCVVASEETPARAISSRRWLALTVLLTGAFLPIVDFTIVNLALPSIRSDLQKSGLWLDVVEILHDRYRLKNAMTLELADALVIERYNLTRLVDRTEKEGFVTRARSPEDGRAAYVTITDAGRSLRKRMWKIYESTVAELFLASSMNPRSVTFQKRLIEPRSMRCSDRLRSIDGRDSGEEGLLFRIDGRVLAIKDFCYAARRESPRCVPPSAPVAANVRRRYSSR